MVINYEYYQIFYHVAKKLNITEAANDLFMSQSTVSRAIQNLERNLECTLLIRSKQGLSLTEEGQFLYEHLKNAVAFISTAENHLNNVKELKSGILRIGATELTLQHFLIPYIKAFERLYPKIHIEYDFEYPKSAIEKLNTGLLDVAILTSPLEENNSIEYHFMKDFEQVIIGGSKYRKYSQEAIDFAQLAKEPFILMKTGSSARAFAEQVFAANNLRCLPKHETGSTPLIISMVEGNMGLGIVPRAFVTEKLAMGSLVEIKTTTPMASLQVYALTSKIFQVSAVRDKFLAQLKTNVTNDLSLL